MNTYDPASRIVYVHMAAVADPGPLPSTRTLLVNAGSGWRYLGAAAMTVTNTTGSPQALPFRVNDDVPGKGSGAFRVSSAFTCRS